jgi:hypothetical protein
MNLETRIRIEKQIVRRIVHSALVRGWSVSVYDGEEWTVTKSVNLKEILNATFTTDEDVLRFHDADGVVGVVTLVYGNDGWDVVADHTADDRIDDLMKPINELSDKLCLRYA